MNDVQRTLRKTIEIQGQGLFSGRPVTLRCLPAPENSGVVFVRTDLPGAPEIPGTVEYLMDPRQTAARSTGLHKGDACVAMVEHVMSAFCGLGVDNVRVEMDAPEAPTGDGSALTFAQPIMEAGLEEQSASRTWIAPDRPMAVTAGDAYLSLAPQEAGLTLTYVLDYGEKFFKSQVGTVTVTPESFMREIAPARTYCLRPEIEMFQKMGLGKGANMENTLIVEEDGRMAQEQRVANECVRHKIQDLLGDLYLTGGALRGRVLGYKSGHAINVMLAGKLYQTYR